MESRDPECSPKEIILYYCYLDVLVIEEFIPLGYYVSGQLPSNFFIGEDILIWGCSFYTFDYKKEERFEFESGVIGYLGPGDMWEHLLREHKLP